MILTGLLAALILLPYALLPGPFWDGWIYRELYPRGFDAFMQPYIDNGRPLGGWCHWLAMKTLGPEAGPLLWSMLAMALTAAAAQALWRRHLRCDPWLATALGLVTAITPAFATALGATMTQFFTGLALISAGTLCFSLAGSAAAKVRAVLLCVCGGLLLLGGTLLSESGLALTVLAPLAFAHSRRPQGTAAELLRLALPQAWVCVLCAAGLAAMFAMAPAVGSYAHAHDVNLGALRFAQATGSMAISLLAANGLLVAMLAAVWVARRPLPDAPPAAPALIAGGLLLLLACTPYIAAGRLTSPFGWGSRMMLLTGAGTALVAYALGSRLLSQRALAAALIACTLLGVAARWPFWAGRQLLQDSLISSLRQLPQEARLTEIVLSEVPSMVAQPYRDYELTLMARQALGRQDVIARLQPGSSAAVSAYLVAHGLPGGAAVGRCWQGRFVRSEGLAWWLAAVRHPLMHSANDESPTRAIPAPGLSRLEPQGGC